VCELDRAESSRSNVIQLLTHPRTSQASCTPCSTIGHCYGKQAMIATAKTAFFGSSPGFQYTPTFRGTYHLRIWCKCNWTRILSRCMRTIPSETPKSSPCDPPTAMVLKRLFQLTVRERLRRDCTRKVSTFCTECSFIGSSP
jgi:hypothetical protein